MVCVVPALALLVPGKGSCSVLVSICRLMAAVHLHRRTEQAAPGAWAGAGSSACSPASSLCCSDHITPNMAT